MNLVVAVSGGVDSVVLLDILVRQNKDRLVVAHFDHGIRKDSAADARFVEGLAEKYQLPFETKREDLGVSASEDLARTRRYQFLREVAKKHNAKIVTAHHMNDVAETIVINLVRGTGWRGLAVLDSDIIRPLLGMTKSRILQYALDNQLEWCEDSTNSSTTYLRNRIRRKIIDESMVHKLTMLRDQQVVLKEAIELDLLRLIVQPPYSRYFFSQIDVGVAIECLRKITDTRLTRPQIERLLLAIKTYKPGTTHEAGAGVKAQFSTRHFSLEMLK